MAVDSIEPSDDDGLKRRKGPSYRNQRTAKGKAKSQRIPEWYRSSKDSEEFFKIVSGGLPIPLSELDSADKPPAGYGFFLKKYRKMTEEQIGRRTLSVVILLLILLAVSINYLGGKGGVGVTLLFAPPLYWSFIGRLLPKHHINNRAFVAAYIILTVAIAIILT